MHWTVHLEGGPQRVNHAAVAVGSKIYSFGGYSSSEGYEVSGKIDIYVLDTDTLRWSPLAYVTCGDEVPFKRYGHTVAAHGRRIYLWGGRNDLSASNILHCFDVDSLTWTIPPTTGKPPLAADGHSACVINDYMYIFGGFQDDTEKFGQTVHRLNLNILEWEEVETYDVPPVSRDFHTASPIGTRMYIFGGRSSNEDIVNEHVKSEFYCNKIMYLNTENMKWCTPSTLGRPPCGRRSHSAVVYENKIYIIGGYNGITQNHLNDVHQYDPLEEQWSVIKCLGKGPCPRRRHCACVVRKQLFLFGGSSPRIEGEKISTSGQDFQKLIDHSDLHVLDFFPTLKRLCQLKVIRYGMNLNLLPRFLNQEIHFMTTNNIITRNDFFPRKDYGVFSFSA